MIFGINAEGGFTSIFHSLFSKANKPISGNEFSKLFDLGRTTGDFTEFTNSIKDGSVHLEKLKDIAGGTDEALKNIPKSKVDAYFNGLGTSLDRSGQKIEGFGNKLKAFGTSLLNIGAGMLIGVGIQGTISLVNDLITAEDGLRESARKVSEEYHTTKESVESYKEQISSLYKVINDEKSSDQEVYDARSQLLDIQNSLIDNYGEEAGAIGLVTDAINGQIKALDTLSEKKWDKKHSDFDSLWTGEISDIGRAVQNWEMRNRTGAGTNTEAVRNIMERWTGINRLRSLPSKSNTKDKQILERLEKEYEGQITTFKDIFGNLTGEFVVSFGDIDQNIEELSNIINGLDEEGASADLKNAFSTLLSKANKDAEAYRDYYRDNLLLEDIFDDKAKTAVYDDIEEIHNKYQKAFSSGNEEAKQSAIEELSDIFANLNFDDSINKYFKEMYPELAAEVNEWDFKVKLQPDLEEFGKQKYTKENILEMFQTKGLQEGEKELIHIRAQAREYGLITEGDKNEIQNLINYLVKWGIIQSEITEEAAKTNKEYAKRTAADAVDSLADTKKAITSLSDLYGQVAKKGENVTNFGFADPDTLNSIEQAFTQLADSRDEVEQAELSQALKDFEETMVRVPKDSEEAQKAIDKLVTSYIDHSDVLRDLTEENKEWAEAQLTAMGITNAHEVVMNRLSNQNKEVAKSYGQLQDALGEYATFSSDYDSKIEAWNKELEELQKGGNVNLLLRPAIDAEEFVGNGWDNLVDDYATVLTETFTNEVGDIAVNFTPIMVDPNTGEYLGVMEKGKFTQYCEDVIAGVHSDYLNLQIGAEFTGEDALDQAEEAAQRIHTLHEELHDSNLFSEDGYDDYIKNVTKGLNDVLAVYNDFGNKLSSQSFEVDDSFVERHIEDVKRMADGDEEAFARIRRAAAIEAVMKITPHIPMDVAEQQANQLVDYISNLDGMNIEIGANVNDQEFINGLNAMLRSGKYTAEQMQEAFKAMGYTVKINEKKGKALVPSPNGGHVTQIYGKNGPEIVRWDSVPVDYSFPEVEIITKTGSSGGGGTGGGGLAHYTPPKSDTGSKGGSGGGGGGGGSSKDPTEEAADKIADTAEDTAKTIEDAAKEAIDKVVKFWDEAISLMEDQINDVQFAIDKAINEKDIARLRNKSVRGKWKDVVGNKKYLKESYDQLAGGYAAKAEAIKGELGRQIAAGAIQPGSDTEKDYTKQIMEAANQSQDAILNAQKAEIDYLEMYKQRREDWLTGLEKIVDKWQTITNKWSKTVDRMWTFANKNWAVNKQLRANSKQIAAQERVIWQNAYEGSRNTGGLGWKLRSKIKDGTWDPRSVKDGYLLQQINDYAEWRVKMPLYSVMSIEKIIKLLELPKDN